MDMCEIIPIVEAIIRIGYDLRWLYLEPTWYAWDRHKAARLIGPSAVVIRSQTLTQPQSPYFVLHLCAES